MTANGSRRWVVPGNDGRRHTSHIVVKEPDMGFFDPPVYSPQVHEAVARLWALPIEQLAAEVLHAMDARIRFHVARGVGDPEWVEQNDIEAQMLAGVLGSGPSLMRNMLGRPVREALGMLMSANLVVDAITGMDLTSRQWTVTRLGQQALADGSVAARLAPSSR
jgi:hypothetical protein